MFREPLRRVPQLHEQLSNYPFLDFLVGRPEGENELSSEEYFDALSLEDKNHVEWVIELLDYVVREKLAEYDIEVGVMAVGSMLKPEEERENPVQDIDLIILHTTEPNTVERVGSIELIDWSLKRVVDGAEDVDNIKTPGVRLSKIKDYDLDVYQFMFSSGLPIRVFHGHSDAPTMSVYLSIERKEGGYFALLYEN